MKAVSLLLLGLLALASGADAWGCNRHWDYNYRIKHGNIIDPVPGQFAQIAFNRAYGLWGRCNKHKCHVKLTPIEACYDSIKVWHGQQIRGTYAFTVKADYTCGHGRHRKHHTAHHTMQVYTKRNGGYFAPPKVWC